MHARNAIPSHRRLNGDYTPAVARYDCLLAGSRSAGAVVFRMQSLLSRWGFGLVQLIVVVVVAVSLVRWGFGLDATGGDAVAAFVSV